MNTRFRNLVGLASIAAIASIGLAGCSSSSGKTDSAASSSSTPATHKSPMNSMHTSPTPTGGATSMPTISIDNFAFQGATSVQAGAKVMVSNADSTNHTVTSDQPGLFDVVVPANGGSATFTAPSKPGTYAYHCTYHATMHGKLVVK